MQLRQDLQEYANLVKYKGQRFITRNGRPIGGAMLVLGGLVARRATSAKS